MKANRILTGILFITILLVGQVYASLLHSETSPTKYLAVTYNFVPVSIEYTLTPGYIYDEDSGNRIIRNIASSAQVNTNQSYLDRTEMIELNFNSTSYGTPLDVNSSSSTYAYTQKNFSPYLSVSYTNLSSVARFEFIDGVVPAYSGSSDFAISWQSRQFSNQIDSFDHYKYQLNQNAYNVGRKISSLGGGDQVVAYVNYESITKKELEEAILSYNFSIKENTALGHLTETKSVLDNTEILRDNILRRLIEEKVILSYLKKTGQYIDSNEVFDYRTLYQQMTDNNDEIGIKSLNYVLDCLYSYALGQNMSLDEYLNSISTKLSERNALASWKDRVLLNDNETVEESIAHLCQEVEIIILK